jgi:CBS domain-containing protein
MMEIREVMTTEVQLVDPNTTLKDAAQMMRHGDFGLLPIGENDRLIGTITDRDIAVRAVAAGKDPSRTPVRDAMSEGVTYCFEDQSVAEAAALMGDKQIRRLPVLDRNKRLVGIVAIGDLAVEREADDEAGEALSEISKH